MVISIKENFHHGKPDLSTEGITIITYLFNHDLAKSVNTLPNTTCIMNHILMYNIIDERKPIGNVSDLKLYIHIL